MKVRVRLVSRAAKLGIVVGLAGLFIAPMAASASPTKPDAGTKLVGVFKITAGSCSSAGVTSGSYFRMLTPAGATYVANTSSPCGDETYTPLSPGKNGGLSTKKYQPNPSPEFDSSGNALANKIMEPQSFENVNFSVSTNATDPQTGDATEIPTITVSKAGKLKGNLDAWSVGWNNQNFNQGAPKPSGAAGTTTGPTGTYNSSTKTFVIQWSSEISGGPFNDFTGEWYLTGTFSS
jgi:hypothetical protein